MPQFCSLNEKVSSLVVNANIKLIVSISGLPWIQFISAMFTVKYLIKSDGYLYKQLKIQLNIYQLIQHHSGRELTYLVAHKGDKVWVSEYHY